MKLLHIALGNHNKGLWKAFDDHFETKHYNWLEDANDVDKINRKVLQLHKKHNPDVVFMQIQKEGIISIETAKQITKSSYTINWTGDVRYPLPEWFVDLGKHISITLFSNMRDVLLARQQGINSDFLQVGFDEKLFTPYGEKMKCPSIVFMGSNYLSNGNFPLSQFRAELVKRLYQKYGSEFMVYGGNWESIVPNPLFLQPEQESMAYRSCKIAINLSHFDYGRYSSDRIFRMMGSGAFCLSHNYEGIENDFKIKKHLDIWNNVDELISKIDFYIKNEYLRELIAKNGTEYIRNLCTWSDRMNELKRYIL